MIARNGVTLLELLVVVTILGIMAGIVGLAAPHSIAVAGVDSATATAMSLRGDAIRSGRVVRGELSLKGRTIVVSAYPDGRVLADSALHVDALSGRSKRATK